jgi:hypothetical protein
MAEVADMAVAMVGRMTVAMAAIMAGALAIPAAQAEMTSTTTTFRPKIVACAGIYAGG